jgi:N-acetylneuraminic acid mutarotase
MIFRKIVIRFLGVILMALAIAAPAWAVEFLRWTSGPVLPNPGINRAAVAVGSTVYVMGGWYQSQNQDDLWALYPGAAGWTVRASLPTPMPPVAAVVDGKIYAIGYGNGSYGNVYRYDPANNTWTARAHQNYDALDSAAAAVGGKIYVMGGQYSNGGPSSTLAVYDPLADTWAYRANMPTARMALTAVETGGLIYAIGGTGDDSTSEQSLSVVEAYDPATNTWATKASMPRGKKHAAGALMNGIIYMFGGSWPDGDAAVVEAYDPATDSWNTALVAPSNGSRSTPVAASVDGKLYYIGGHAISSDSPAGVDSTLVDVGTFIPFVGYPRTGEFRIHNNIIRVKRGDEALIFLKDTPGASYELRVFTRGGKIPVFKTQGITGPDGVAVVRFSGQTVLNGTGEPLVTGMYWVVIKGATVKGRKPIVVVNE